MSEAKAWDFTTGSILGHLIRFAGPYLLANLLQACYNAVDVIVVGHTVGSSGTSAIGVGAQVMVMITAACSGLCMGGTIALSQHKGAGDEVGQRKSVGTFLTAILLSACMISVVGILLSGQFVRWMNTPPEAAAQACAYLRICCGGILFIFGYNAVCSVFRGLGDTKHPLYFIFAAAVLNIALDLLFVSVLDRGAAGAALATVISQGVSFLSAAVFLQRKSRMIQIKTLGLDRGELKIILKVGIPSMCQTMLVHVSFLIVGAMINSYGLTASAVNTVGARISNFFLLPRQAIAFAVGNMVGQNMGAGKTKRAAQAVRIGVKLSMAAALGMFTLFNLFAPQAVALFDSSLDVIAEGCRYIHIVSIGYLIMAPMTVYNNLAIGVGQSTRSMLNSMTDSIFVRIPLCTILNDMVGLQLTGIYIGMSLSPIAAVCMGWWYFHRGNWREERLLEKADV